MHSVRAGIALVRCRPLSFNSAPPPLIALFPVNDNRLHGMCVLRHEQSREVTSIPYLLTSLCRPLILETPCTPEDNWKGAF